VRLTTDLTANFGQPPLPLLRPKVDRRKWIILECYGGSAYEGSWVVAEINDLLLRHRKCGGPAIYVSGNPYLPHSIAQPMVCRHCDLGEPLPNHWLEFR